MCALSPSALIPIENFEAIFLGFLFLRFFKCCEQNKQKTKWDSDSIPTALSSVLLSLVREPKGIEQKMFKRVWQVVETIFFASKITFFVETCENLEFLIFFRIFLVQVEENYTKNNDLQYFLFQIKIANAILRADEVLQRRGALRDFL